MLVESGTRGPPRSFIGFCNHTTHVPGCGICAWWYDAQKTGRKIVGCGGTEGARALGTTTLYACPVLVAGVGNIIFLRKELQYAMATIAWKVAGGSDLREN